MVINGHPSEEQLRELTAKMSQRGDTPLSQKELATLTAEEAENILGTTHLYYDIHNHGKPVRFRVIFVQREELLLYENYGRIGFETLHEEYKE